MFNTDSIFSLGEIFSQAHRYKNEALLILRIRPQLNSDFVGLESEHLNNTFFRYLDAPSFVDTVDSPTPGIGFHFPCTASFKLLAQPGQARLPAVFK